MFRSPLTGSESEVVKSGFRRNWAAQFAISSRSIETEFDDLERTLYESHPEGSEHDLTASRIRSSCQSTSPAHFSPSFDVAASWKIQTKKFQTCPLRTHTCRLHPGHSRAGVWRAGEPLSLTRHRRSGGWGILLFELSVGLGTDMVTPRNRFFFRDDRGQRELSDDVGPCGAMVGIFLSLLDDKARTQGCEPSQLPLGYIGRPIGGSESGIFALNSRPRLVSR